GAPETIRTSDPCLRRAVLYPAELQALGVEGTRREGRKDIPEAPGRPSARATKRLAVAIIRVLPLLAKRIQHVEHPHPGCTDAATPLRPARRRAARAGGCGLQ